MSTVNYALEIACQIRSFLHKNMHMIAVHTNNDSAPWTMSQPSADGSLTYAYGLMFGLWGRARSTKFIIVYEPDDTYTVYVWRASKPISATMGTFLEVHKGIYCDMLNELLQVLYNEYVHGSKRPSGWEGDTVALAA